MRIFTAIVLLCAMTTSLAAQPMTVGTVNIVGPSFRQVQTDFLDLESVYFLEVLYDGVAPLTIDTFDTIDVADTELALYDELGIVLQENDDAPSTLTSRLSFGMGELPAGTYFLAVGGFNTVFAPNFLATSTSNGMGDVVVTFETEAIPVLTNINNIAMNYNFNGIVHANEDADPINDPDHPNGFRSISDRALDFRNGIPSDATLDRYSLVTDGGELDIVHLGNRNLVSAGEWAFDPTPDFDATGVQPDWLPDADQTGRQTTTLATPIELDATSQITVLFQISNGGGSFDVVVGLCNGQEIVTTVNGPDWFGPFNGQPNVGAFEGAFGTDFAFIDALGENTLLLTEAIIPLGDNAGSTVEYVAFENSSSINIGIGIVGTNIVGTPGACSGELTFPADSVTLFRGVAFGGTESDTFTSNDVAAMYRPGFVLNDTEAPVWLIFDGTSPNAAPSGLDLSLEAQAGTPGLTATLEAFNWTTNSYDVVDTTDATFNVDSVVTVNLTAGIPDYVQGGSSAVRARAGWRQTGFIINFPWVISVDQLAWTVQ